MDKLLVGLTFLGAILALVFSVVTAKKVMSFSEGTDLMKKISQSIRKGADAYLKRSRIVAMSFCGPRSCK